MAKAYAQTLVSLLSEEVGRLNKISMGERIPHAGSYVLLL